MEKIRLWTIQTRLAWSVLQERGVLKGDGRYADRHFRKPYAWLRGQLKDRIKGYDGGYPLWLWEKRPDLRRERYSLGRAKEAVLIVCDLPKSEVVLFDYDSWHVILNNGYFAHSEAEWDEFDRKLASGEMNSEEWHSLKIKSWERVFDSDELLKHPDWHGPGPLRLQGVTRQIALSDVVHARVFRAR